MSDNINLSMQLSWETTEKYFQQLVDEQEDFSNLVPLYLMIKKMRANGAYKNYYLSHAAPQQLIFSIKPPLDLKKDDQFVAITSLDGYDFQLSLKDGVRLLKQYTVDDLGDELLTQLLQLLTLSKR